MCEFYEKTLFLQKLIYIKNHGYKQNIYNA